MEYSLSIRKNSNNDEYHFYIGQVLNGLLKKDVAKVKIHENSLYGS